MLHHTPLLREGAGDTIVCGRMSNFHPQRAKPSDASAWRIPLRSFRTAVSGLADFAALATSATTNGAGSGNGVGGRISRTVAADVDDGGDDVGGGVVADVCGVGARGREDLTLSRTACTSAAKSTASAGEAVNIACNGASRR